jgi:hypothetical protein
VNLLQVIAKIRLTHILSPINHHHEFEHAQTSAFHPGYGGVPVDPDQTFAPSAV